MALVGGWSVLVIGRCVALARGITSATAGSRGGIAVMVGLLAASGLNDLLLSARVVVSVQTMEYALAVFAVCASFVSMRRVDQLYSGLEATVDERTRDLRENGERLAEALARLGASEARFRRLADASTDGVVVVEGGCVSDVNAALARMVGAEPETLVGRRLESLFVDETGESLASALTSDGPRDVRVRRANGTEFLAEITGRSERRQSEPTFLTVRDVEERRAAESKAITTDRLASLGRLAAGAAHEINNPLTYVSANLDLLLERVNGLALPAAVVADLRELLSEAREGSDRVVRIVRDLRSLARESDDATSSVRVEDVVDVAIKMCAAEVRHRARLVRDYAATPPAKGTEARIGQVLINLIMNAAQAIPPGNATAHEIRIVTRSVRDDLVTIEVSDTGSGIEDDVLERIFEPFVTTKSGTTGMGLGLSICHSIVTSLGGTISARNRPEGGATFRVELPVGAPLRTTLRIPTAVEAPTGRARVLVVDDEPVVALVLRRALSQHDVHVAPSGRDALALCSERSFDVVFCDVMMPDLSGIQVYEQLVGSDPDLAARVVFMTAGTFTEGAREFLARVTNPCLEKPLDVTRVRAIAADLAGRAPSGRVH